LILPIVIVSSQEALKAVPPSLREAAYGLGATKWQVIRHHVLPAALPGILTGTILALATAMGETAPLLVTGASGTVTRNPDSPLDGYTVIPVQIYHWSSQASSEYREVAAAAIIVMMVILFAMNALAIVLRQYFSRKLRW
jgi:phosphate transport system permease protein